MPRFGNRTKSARFSCRKPTGFNLLHQTVQTGYINGNNFYRLTQDSLYIRAFSTSVYNASIATFLCLIVGYPMALALTRVSRTTRNILLMPVILPFWTSFLLRVYAWIGMMGSNSWFNKLITSMYNSVALEEWAIRFVLMMSTNFESARCPIAWHLWQHVFQE